MLLRLCQLKSQTLFLFSLMILCSCSWRKDAVRTPSELLTTFPNHWFSTNPHHSLIKGNTGPVPHLLFDTTPEFKPTEKLVNVVIAVPEGSAHSYHIDLNSGQRHYSHSYCKQTDIWSSYNSSVNRPVFSVGHIPRVLDQLGDAQKVIVFTKRKSFIELATSNYHQVKLIGAYVEQICPEGNCLGKSNWLSKLVFIGIDAEDLSLAGVDSLEDFKKIFNWETAKAHLENMDGRNFIGDSTYPAVKVGQLIEYQEAFDFFKKRSIFLTDTELKKIQKGCHALYDGLWEEVGKTRPEDLAAKNNQEFTAKTRLTAQLKKEKRPVGFAARFKRFTKKYFKEISTCEKFVYHGNLNQDPEKFWFLSYAGIYYLLHREGYFFDCEHKTWQRNILNDEGSPVFDLKRDINKCNEYEFDQAMSYLPNFLTGLKGEKEFFRFIDYDTHSFGTHNKMYSWVKVKSLKFDCRNDPNAEIKKQLKLFPEDINWKQRHAKDIADESKNIQ